MKHPLRTLSLAASITLTSIVVANFSTKESCKISGYELQRLEDSACEMYDGPIDNLIPPCYQVNMRYLSDQESLDLQVDCRQVDPQEYDRGDRWIIKDISPLLKDVCASSTASTYLSFISKFTENYR